jgi:hypothetical protein
MPLPLRPTTSSITTPTTSSPPINIILNTPKQERRDYFKR